MNIAIVINSLKIGGGAERAASIVGNELKRRGYNVYFLVFNNCEMKYPISGEYHIIDTGINSNNSLKAFLNIFLRGWKIASFCRNKKVDAAVSFMEEANFSNVLSRILFRNKSRIVLSVRANPIFKGAKSKLFMKILHKKADMVVANSKVVEKILNEDFGINKTYTIYNTVDIDKIEQEKKETIDKKEENIFDGGSTLINIGRLTRQKGQWHLIRSFAEVVKFKPKAKLVIIGSGELLSDYKGMISRLGLENNIFFLGHKQNIFPYLSRSKAFIFTSIFEGMPNVLIEAASLGLPIISTDCPTGAREVIAPDLEIEQEISYPYNNEYGVLLDNFDDYPFYDNLLEKPLSIIEKSFSEAMLDILDETNKRKKLIKEREEFSLDNVIELWEMIIKGNL